MTFKLDISAGEFFELIRPSVLVLSALVSTWVLASARRHRFTTYVAIAWAVVTLFFPLIALPLYLIARLIRRRTDPATRRIRDAQNTEIIARSRASSRTPGVRRNRLFADWLLSIFGSSER